MRIPPLKKAVQYLLVTLLILFCWWVLARLIDNPALAEPTGVLQRLYLLRAKIWHHLLVSLGRVLAGVGLALIGGVFLGLLLGMNRRFDRILAPLVYLAYPIPKIAFLPVVLLFLGLGNLSKVFLIALIVFFQVVVTTRDAARDIDPELLLSVRSLGANTRQLFWQVVFPAALPEIFTAVRISTGTAIAVLFFTETFATFSGLGYFIIDAWTRVNYREMYAGILALSLLGLFLFLLIDFLERLCCPWLYLHEEK